jgi:hypothetical protein
MAIKTRKKRSKKRIAFYKLRAILEKQEIDNKRKEEKGLTNSHPYGIINISKEKRVRFLL